MNYDSSLATEVMMAPMHNMADFQYEGVWGRCWFDLGTSDLIAIDVLINALTQLDKEFVPIRLLIIGGENEDWPVDPKQRSPFDEFAGNVDNN
jgi:hypothetical protein